MSVLSFNQTADGQLYFFSAQLWTTIVAYKRSEPICLCVYVNVSVSVLNSWPKSQPLRIETCSPAWGCEHPPGSTFTIRYIHTRDIYPEQLPTCQLSTTAHRLLVRAKQPYSVYWQQTVCSLWGYDVWLTGDCWCL